MVPARKTPLKGIAAKKKRQTTGVRLAVVKTRTLISGSTAPAPRSSCWLSLPIPRFAAVLTFSLDCGRDPVVADTNITFRYPAKAFAECAKASAVACTLISGGAIGVCEPEIYTGCHSSPYCEPYKRFSGHHCIPRTLGGGISYLRTGQHFCHQPIIRKIDICRSGWSRESECPLCANSGHWAYLLPRRDCVLNHQRHTRRYESASPNSVCQHTGAARHRPWPFF